MDHSGYLSSYIQGVKGLIGLGHWEISIQIAERDIEADATSNTMAEVIHASDRPCAVVIFYPSFFDENLDQQRHYVVHELIHLHVDRLWKHIAKLEPLLGQLAFSLYGEAARSDMEEVVDALAYAIENMVPYPRGLVSYPRGEDKNETRTQTT